MSDQIVNNCPACDCATLGERGMYDICPVCFWEDDGIWSETHPNEPGGGPNYELSLNQVKANFAQYGVCDLKNIKHVRQPTLEEAHGNEDFMMAVEQRQAAEKIQTSPPLI